MITVNAYPAAYVLSGNPVLLDLEIAPSGSNYKIVCEVYREDFGKIGEEIITTYAYQENIIFDASEYILADLEYNRNTNFTLNFTGGRVGFLHATHARKYYLKYAEIINYETGDFETGSTITALLGGISEYKINKHGTFNNYFKAWQSEQPFLNRSMHWEKIISKTTPERLFFLNKETRSMQIEYYLKFTDNSSDLILSESFSSDEGQVTEIDVSYKPDWDDYSLPVKYYLVTLWDASVGDYVSLAKKYILDNRHYRNEEYFIYRNGMGGYDTFRFTGRLTHKANFTRSIFQDVNRVTRNYQNILNDDYIINTGSISKDDVAVIEELFLSCEVFWIKENIAVPVVINSKKKTPTTNDQRRFNVSIDFTIAKNEQYA